MGIRFDPETEIQECMDITIRSLDRMFNNISYIRDVFKRANYDSKFVDSITDIQVKLEAVDDAMVTMVAELDSRNSKSA